MMIGIMPHLFQVIMLSRYPQAFLCIGHPLPCRILITEKDILELVHPGIGKHQGRIVLDYHRG